MGRDFRSVHPDKLASEISGQPHRYDMRQSIEEWRRRWWYQRTQEHLDGGQPSAATGGIATQLAITAQPQNAAGGASLGTITVQVQDAFGNPAAGVYAIAATVGNNPGPGVLSGTLIQTTANGTATFNDLVLNDATGSNGYTLTFYGPPGFAVTSAPFNLTAASAGWTKTTVNSTGNPSADGATLLSTILGASANTIIVVGGGTFAFGNNACQTPDAVHILAAASASTLITSAYSAGASSCLRLGSNATFSGFTFNALLNNGPFQFPIGNAGTDNPTTAGVLVNVTVLGNSDGFYFAVTGQTSTVTAILCSSTTAFDTVQFFQVSGVLRLFDCTHHTSGPNAQGVLNARGVVGSDGSILAYYGRVTALNGGSVSGALTVGYETKKVLSSTPTITVYGGTVVTSSPPGGTIADLIALPPTVITEYGLSYNTVGQGTIYLNNVLAITQPATTPHGSAISPALTVAFQDGNGNTQNVTGSVQVFLQNAGTGKLVPFASGTLAQTASSGVCTFNDLVVGAPGTYLLIFAALGMPNVVSAVFNVI